MTKKEPRYNVMLSGTMTLVTPFACSPKVDYPLGSEDAAPLPRIDVAQGGSFIRQPFVQASTIRGRIRRAAAHVILSRMEEHNEEPTWEDWLQWALGGVKNSGAESTDIIERHRLISSNAVLSMFGAGVIRTGGMVGGSFLIDPGIPSDPITPSVIRSARRAENKAPELFDFLSLEQMEVVKTYTDNNRENSLAKKEKQRLQKIINTFERAKATGKASKVSQEEYDAAIEAINGVSTTVAAISENSIGRPLAGYEVLPVNLTIPHRMIIKSATAEHIGFVVAALKLFGQAPYIGAHLSHGCGQIEMSYNVTHREGLFGQAHTDGTIDIGDFIHGATVKSDFLAECLEKWEKSTFIPANYRA